MMKKRSVRFFWIGLLFAGIIATGCGPRKFLVRPQVKDFDFTVSKTFGTLAYIPLKDARDQFDKEGKIETSCFYGYTGIMHLGDQNYQPNLVNEFDTTLRVSLQNSHLFSDIGKQDLAQPGYTFSASLERFHVLIDEEKAVKTRACIGGLIGAAVAASIEVTAMTELKLTGRLTKGAEELWLHTVTKQITTTADYSDTELNAENSMGQAIGESCKDLITELAKYLSSK